MLYASSDAHPPNSDSVLQEVLLVPSSKKWTSHYDLLFPGTSFWLYIQPTFGKHSIQPRKCYNPFTCQIENRGFLGQMEEIRALCSDHQCPRHHPSIKMNSCVIVIEMEAGNSLLLALSYQQPECAAGPGLGQLCGLLRNFLRTRVGLGTLHPRI